MPGHYLQYDSKGLVIRKYWSIDDLSFSRDDEDVATKKVRHLLERAVESHLVSDVPVGVALSGGIDSSAIAIIAGRKLGKNLQTISVGFDYDKGINELSKARKVAELAGSNHHELHVSASGVPELIDLLYRRDA